MDIKLTDEQIDIINSTGNIKINAVAGSGKTTTIIEYARSRPANSKILYLAFNKAVKLEAVRKFADCSITNVRIETAHSLAYRHIVFRHGYKVRAQGYKISEIVDILSLKGNGEKHTEHIIANHIGKFLACFCNSAERSLIEVDYLGTVFDKKARTFVTNNYKYIEAQAKRFFRKMDDGEIEITHDFYLKKFQLSDPQLDFDYILFDEGQDASAAMLDIFFRQAATRVIVGDTHQQIYSWRYAVNSLEQADYKTYHLSTSFRFGKDIASLAAQVLKYKRHIDQEVNVTINGLGAGEEIKTKAVLARTNLGLLLKAIEYVTEKPDLKDIYFEGNINSYTYADDGASLYDILHLYNGRRSLIRDKLIREMKDLDELNDYIEKTEDVQLGMMVDIVNEYGNDIPDIIRNIKSKHIEGDEKGEAEMVFSTVHRCKGMEYDAVQLVEDFITEEKLEKLKKDKAIFPKLSEEINLVYVAVTRAKRRVYIPSSLMPKDFPASDAIKIIKTRDTPGNSMLQPDKEQRTSLGLSKQKTMSFEERRKEFKDAYRPWTTELDAELLKMYEEGSSPSDVAKHFGRTMGAISSRIRQLQQRQDWVE